MFPCFATYQISPREKSATVREKKVLVQFAAEGDENSATRNDIFVTANLNISQTRLRHPLGYFEFAHLKLLIRSDVRYIWTMLKKRRTERIQTNVYASFSFTYVYIRSIVLLQFTLFIHREHYRE